MEKVATAIPAKWRLVGIQLKLPTWTLESIQHQNAERMDGLLLSFEWVFTEWERQKTSPHTWETIINALRAPAVGEHVLADKMLTEITNVS